MISAAWVRRVLDVQWRIYLLGGLRVEGEGRSITRFRAQKAGALLAYLAYHPEHSHLRDQLVELLWPEYDPHAARNNLSRELSGLRDQLEPPGTPASAVIAADRTTIRLNPDAVTTDVAAFEAALHSAESAGNPAERAQQLAQAIETYGGELLPGYYDDWILQEREWLADRYFQALGQLLTLLEQAGEFPRALEYARRGVRADPLREEAHRDLMRLLAAGQLAAALRQYRELERLLKQELDAEPSAVTRALARQLAARANERQEIGETQAQPRAPAPPAAVTPPHRLSVPRTPLLGREKEVAVAPDLLRREEVGLVTFTGPGGTGKTRLALQVAAELRDDFPDGIFFVDLAPLRDPGLVPSTIAQVLGVRESAGRSILEGLKESLRERHLLLLLDNFEPVLEAAPLLAELLDAAPRLKLLVTSRIVLRLQAEHEFPVPPLALPPVGTGEPCFGRAADSGGGRSPGLVGALPTQRGHPQGVPLQEYAAIELFVQRARAARPEFRLTEENAPSVAQICCRLDGLPLAIELAAARIRLLPPQALLARLENRLRLLTGGARDLPERQQSLRNTIAWSYDLLDESDKRLFRRLAVFVGGFTLDAAERVCSDGDRPPADDRQRPTASGRRSAMGGREVLEGVASLIDRSLLQALDGESEEPRFGMLETIREYAQESLAASGEVEATRCRHALFFLELADEIEPKLQELNAWVWLNTLEAEHDNLRAALEWSLRTTEDTDLGLRLAGALNAFWNARGYLDEGRRWLQGALARSRNVPMVLRAKALLAAGSLARQQSDYTSARRFGEQSLAVWRALHDTAGVSASLSHLGWVASSMGHRSEAQLRFEESLALNRQLGNLRGIARSLDDLGRLTELQGDHASAWALLEESLGILRQLQDGQGIAVALDALGMVAFNRRDYPVSRTLCQQSLAIRRDLGDDQGIARSLRNLGDTAREQKEFTAARELYEESRKMYRALKDPWGVVMTLEGQGHLARAQGDYASAHQLYQEQLAICEELGDRSLIAVTLDHLGQLASVQEVHELARMRFEESLAIYRALGHTWGIAKVLWNLGFLSRRQADHAEAYLRFQEGLVPIRELGDREWAARSLGLLGELAWSQGQMRTAQERWEESLTIWRELDRPQEIAVALRALGEVARSEGDYATARALFADSLAITREDAHKGGAACALFLLGTVELALGEAASACALFKESLAIQRELDDRQGIVCSLEGFAMLAVLEAQHARAACLFGVVAAQDEHDGRRWSPQERSDYKSQVAATSAALGDEAFAAACAAGRDLPLDQAVAYAMQGTLPA